MSKDAHHLKSPRTAQEQRTLAEKRLRGQTSAETPAEEIPPTPDADADQTRRRAETLGLRPLVHELQVHQIELDMQNEELRESHAAVEAGLERYTDLYDFAPVGYLSLDPQGTMLQMNLAGARLLAKERARLVGSPFAPFVAPPDRPAFAVLLADAFATRLKQTREITLEREGLPPLVVQIEATLSADGDECRAVLLDVTARRAAEREKESLAAVFRRTGAAIFLTDAEGRIEWVNSAFPAMTGHTLDDARGKHPGEVAIGPGTDPATLARLRQALARQTGFDGEILNYRKDGAPCWLQLKIDPIPDSAGRLLQFVGVQIDISERKGLEEAVRATKERFRLLTDHAPVLIWIAAPDKRRIHFNQVWLDFTGRPLAAEADHGWTEGVHPDDRPRCRKTASAAIDARRKFSMEYRLRRHDGEHRWILDNGVPHFAEDGAYLGHLGSCVDITERKQADEDLRRSQERLSLTFQAVTEGLLVITEEGVILDCNKEAERILGVGAGEMMARTLANSPWRAIREDGSPFPPADYPFRRALRTGQSVRDSVMGFTAPDGQFQWVSVSAAALRDPEGGMPLAVTSFIDITARRRAKADLRAAKEQAEAASRAKSEFLATITHEVRTPLNAVIGFTDLLRAGHIDPARQKEYLDFIAVGSERLLLLMDNVIDYSNLAAGSMELNRAPFNLAYEIHAAINHHRPAAQAKGLDLLLDLPENLPAFVEGDARRVGQIFTQLIGNAVKFTAAGHVAVRVEARSEPPEPNWRLHCAIADTGVGVPEGMGQAIFQPFHQADSSATRPHDGAGLSLALVQRLVQLMGGAIRHESPPEGGARFTFDLLLPESPLQTPA